MTSLSTLISSHIYELTNEGDEEKKLEITELVLVDKGIVHTSGLMVLKNLRKLDIRKNQIVLLTSLYLENLEELDIGENQISSLTDVDRVRRSLKVLRAEKNVIKEISPLSRCTKLEILNLSFNQIERIEGLDALSKLRVLNLNDNQMIRKIEGIGNLRNLQSLLLVGNQIRDIPERVGWENLTKLKNLALHKNALTAPLNKLHVLKNLERIGLAYNNITTVKGLMFEWKNLETIDLRGNSLEKQSVFEIFSFYCKQRGIEIQVDEKQMMREVLLKSTSTGTKDCGTTEKLEKENKFHIRKRLEANEQCKKAHGKLHRMVQIYKKIEKQKEDSDSELKRVKNELKESEGKLQRERKEKSNLEHQLQRTAKELKRLKIWFSKEAKEKDRLKKHIELLEKREKNRRKEEVEAKEEKFPEERAVLKKYLEEIKMSFLLDILIKHEIFYEDLLYLEEEDYLLSLEGIKKHHARRLWVCVKMLKKIKKLPSLVKIYAKMNQRFETVEDISVEINDFVLISKIIVKFGLEEAEEFYKIKLKGKHLIFADTERKSLKKLLHELDDDVLESGVIRCILSEV